MRLAGVRSNAKDGRVGRAGVAHRLSARRRIGSSHPSGRRRNGRRRGTVPAWARARATRREAVR
jgi:hypothetical protein